MNRERRSECNWEMTFFFNEKKEVIGRAARFWTEDIMFGKSQDPETQRDYEHLRKWGTIVNDPWMPYPWQNARTCSTNKGAYGAWDANYEGAKSHIVEGCDKAEQEDIVYVVAPGMSLPKNMHHLSKIRHGKVIGMNITPKCGVRSDYYACMDYGIRPETCFDENTPQMVGVFSPQVNWRIPASPVFSRLLWGAPELSLLLFDRIRAENPQLPGITTTPSVGMMATDWAVRYLKPKVIVLVGHDFCAIRLDDKKTFRMHIDGHDDFVPPDYFDFNGNKIPKEHYITEDICGNVCMRIDAYQRILNYHVPYYWFCLAHGIKVINATEGGLLWENCERMRLSSAIAICNLYGDTKDESVLPRQSVEEITINDVPKEKLEAIGIKTHSEGEENGSEKERMEAAVR